MVGGRRTALILAGLVGCGLAFVAAQPYPGVTADSGEYLATADGVVSGHGLSMPYLHVAPSQLRDRRDLVWAGIAGAAATMFRFAGIAAPLGTAIALMFSNGFQRSKVPKALMFLTGALSPLAAWFSRNALVAGYTNDRWRSSETLGFVESLPEPTIIITNAPDPLWVWHERTAFLLPPLANLHTGKENVRHPEQLRALRRATACRVGLVVFFDRPTRKGIRHVAPEAVAGLGLTHRQRFEDGDVYDVDEPPCRTEPPSG